MTLQGELADLRTQAPINGFVTVQRGGQEVLSIDTIGGGFIIDDLLPDDVLTMSATGRKSQTWKASDLDMTPGYTNVFFLSHNTPNLLPVAIAAGAALLLSRKKKVGEVTPGQVVLYAGGAIALSAVVKILEKLGIFKSKGSRDLDEDSTNPDSPWSPEYYKRIKPSDAQWSYALAWTTAVKYCNEIYDSFGAINDCEECAIAVFKRLRTKANLSFLAEVFNHTYGQDLLTFLRGGYWPQDRLSDDDVYSISQYIKNLPDY